MPTRRTILKAAALNAAALNAAALATAELAAPFVIPNLSRAAALRTVKLTLPWVAEGSNAYAFVAKANGYWSDAGLDVQISRGYGSVAAAQAVGSKQFDFGLAAASTGIQAASKGLPTVCIANAGYDATMAVAVLGDSPVRKVSDLAGKSLGGTVNSGEYPFLPAFAKSSGLDLSTVKLVTVDPNVRQRILLERKVDAICGFAVSMAPLFVANNTPIRFFPYSKAGLTFYNNALLTRPEVLKAEPDLCKAMAEGIMKAARFCLLQPDEAVKLFLKQVPEAALAANGPKQIATGLGIFRMTMIAAPAKQHGIGWSELDGYGAMTDLVMKYLGGPDDKKPDPASLFTNEFVGGVKLTPDEWTKADQQVKEYRDYFA
ncbi:MAG TPA: ABC transporter substrate-binding protein [Rhodopila sp.]|uniref:ABC transporter substrate-binding protein n=1 Tax=Rhodopila sp. TaxID=2480087 RepID=UPI002C0CC243|nr:ABC transporter substrate-binding protein [Rhodopila sp.]HVY15817.1 ABC transporter substrate-binding protein [Rhodopila sp.]